MDIEYLQILIDHPKIKVPNHDSWLYNEPISITEIECLESKYNGGQPFPVALRELLFIAGKRCYVLDYGRFDSQEAMQQGARRWLTAYGRNFSIERPFFVIKVYDSDQFLFVYLDEDPVSPTVYEALLYESDEPWIRRIGWTLSPFIRRQTQHLLNGHDLF